MKSKITSVLLSNEIAKHGGPGRCEIQRLAKVFGVCQKTIRRRLKICSNLRVKVGRIQSAEPIEINY